MMTLPSQGEDLGLVQACLRDAEDGYLLVCQATRVDRLSPHSLKFTMRGAETCLWRMHEAVACIAWQREGDEGVAITA